MAFSLKLGSRRSCSKVDTLEASRSDERSMLDACTSNPGCRSATLPCTVESRLRLKVQLVQAQSKDGNTKAVCSSRMSPLAVKSTAKSLRFERKRDDHDAWCPVKMKTHVTHM